MGTANVGSMVGKSREVAVIPRRRKVDVCAVQETRFRNEGTTMYGVMVKDTSFGGVEVVRTIVE